MCSDQVWGIGLGLLHLEFSNGMKTLSCIWYPSCELWENLCVASLLGREAYQLGWMYLVRLIPSQYNNLRDPCFHKLNTVKKSCEDEWHVCFWYLGKLPKYAQVLCSTLIYSILRFITYCVNTIYIIVGIDGWEGNKYHHLLLLQKVIFFWFFAPSLVIF